MKIIKSTLNKRREESIIAPLNEIDESSRIIDLDKSVIAEEIIGFGGAVTESASSVFLSMPKELQEEFLSSVYNKNGLNYNLTRICLGSCDFSLKTYDFLSDDNSLDLSSYETYVLKVLEIINAYHEQIIFLSSWSPPKIYKSNDDYYHGGKLLKEHYEDYIDYYVSFLLEMKNRGFKISFVNVQNEPEAVQVWESCIMSGQEEAALINLLHNKLNENNLSDISILCWDHNKDVIKRRIDETFIDEKTKNITYGIAYHWYDSTFSDDLEYVYNKYFKPLFFTEGCIEYYKEDDSKEEEFLQAMRYFKNYLFGLKNHTIGFTDWNILLDLKGGPNHVGNYCQAPIQYDINNKRLIYRRSYDAIYHFSHFFDRGSKIIECSKDNIAGYIRADGKRVFFIYGEKNEKLTLIIAKKWYHIDIDEKTLITIEED